MTSFFWIEFTTSRPVRHLTEDRMDPVEVALRRMADEELAAAGVLSGVGHRQGARRRACACFLSVSHLMV